MLTGEMPERKKGEMPQPDDLKTPLDNPNDDPEKTAPPPTWDTWLETQDDDTKKLYASHSEGLLNTVKATRDERDVLKTKVKDLAAAQEEGSEIRKELDEISEKLEQSERRATFLEDAIKPEVQCRNPRAAWLLAQAEDLFDRRGNPDWDAIKAAAPELFGVKIANANAGDGTGKKPASGKDMNKWIRTASGR